jgi:hypothetical protein
MPKDARPISILNISVLSLSTASEHLVSNCRLLLLLVLLQRVSHVSTHGLLEMNHKFFEALSKSLQDVRAMG